MLIKSFYCRLAVLFLCFPHKYQLTGTDKHLDGKGMEAGRLTVTASHCL